MENLRDNNYGYELPDAVIEHIEECEESSDEKRLEILDKILDICDYTDLYMLDDYDAIEYIIDEYVPYLNNLESLVTSKQKEFRVFL